MIHNRVLSYPTWIAGSCPSTVRLDLQTLVTQRRESRLEQIDVTCYRSRRKRTTQQRLQGKKSPVPESKIRSTYHWDSYNV